MCTLTTVSVYDNFSSGKTGITMRTTDYKLTGWVDVVFDFIIKEVLVFRIFLDYTRDQDFFHILFDLLQHAFF
ncbi:hypothetical protein D3C80_1604510 [compost metagenome]